MAQDPVNPIALRLRADGRTLAIRPGHRRGAHDHSPHQEATTVSESRLCLHRGAREVPREALARVPVPAPSRRWVPIGHDRAVHTVAAALADGGFRVVRERYALSRDDARLFGTLDLRVEVAPDVTLAVGIRNSLDQSFPLGFCAGHRVFVCDNLCFSAELMVRRKHTRFGVERFRDDIAGCVAGLEAFRLAERARIGRMQGSELTETQAESLMLRAAYDRRILSHRLMPRLIAQWRDPAHPAFEPRTHWSLFNAFTLVMADRARSNPQAFAAATMRLQALLLPEGDDGAALLPSP